ncbi:Hypothetical predicted protein [Paramuricea clavata]|uniref:Uncharacterized protein n=1 Tax=Paramuricea clavata TaxID=317549 RepID=A0A6S7LQ09_PARCT|nr:Hypothetical predicted protein [Paramuricea clavata]
MVWSILNHQSKGQFKQDDVNALQEVIDARTKRSSVQVGFNLASFSMNLMNRMQLNYIERRADKDRELLAISMKEGAARLTVFNEHFQRTTSVIINQVKKLTKISIKLALERTRWEVRSLINTFQIELTDFHSALIDLMHHKTSPLLLDPNHLNQAFARLKERAVATDMRHPVLDDAGLVYQSEVDTLVKNNQLTIFIHVPMYKAPLLDMYKYLQTPIFLQAPLAITIQTEFSHLAVNKERSMAKHFTKEELTKCKIFGDIWHCPERNFLSIKPANLCLFNLFQQQIEQVKANCKNQLEKVEFSATQLGNNKFQLSLPEKVNMTKMCKNDTNTSLQLPEGNSVITIKDDCPTVQVIDHVFYHNPKIVIRHELIHLPLLANRSNWLTEIDRSVNDLLSSYDSMIKVAETVSFGQFLEKINNVKSYQLPHIYTIVVAIGTITLIVLSTTILVLYIKKKLKKLKTKLSEPEVAVKFVQSVATCQPVNASIFMTRRINDQ